MLQVFSGLSAIPLETTVCIEHGSYVSVLSSHLTVLDIV